MQHRLIGAQVSYYTGKVRAYLQHKAIPFEEVAATREVYRDVILPRTGVRFIPVLISADDVAVQDSSEIIAFLEQRYPQNPVLPAGPLQRFVALLFELYADEWLLLPAMHYRWNWPENRAFAIAEFGRLSQPNATPEEQRAIGEQLAGPFAGALPALGVQPETVASIEESYTGFLSEFEAHLAQHAYLLGARPCLGDFALYGPLFAHLYRDPASGRLMKERAPGVAAWVERLPAASAPGANLLSDDQVPSTLEPLLARMFREFGPVLERTIAQVQACVPKAPDAPLPRSLGTHTFRLGAASGTRAIYPFNVWRWQRAYDHYHALSGAARSRADALLDRIGGRSLVELRLSRRLTRRDNRLHFED